MKPLIIYHAHCTDGFGAAYAAGCKFGDMAEYLPRNYGGHKNAAGFSTDVSTLLEFLQ
jgi:hypothetical protein